MAGSRRKKERRRTLSSTGSGLTAVFSEMERKKLFVGTLVLFGLSNTLATVAPNIGVMAGTIGVWRVAQAALFIVCHMRLMKVAPQAPAFTASLNVSGQISESELAQWRGTGDRQFWRRQGWPGSRIDHQGALVLTPVLMSAKRLPLGSGYPL